MSIKDYHAYTGRLASEGMMKRAERGLPCCRPPLGYRLEKTPLRSRVVVDGEAARFVRRAFDCIAAGYSLRKTLADLTAAGMRSQGGKAMSATALWKIVRNPFYLGYVRHMGELLAGGHEPMVSREAFELAQRRLSRRA